MLMGLLSCPSVFRKEVPMAPAAMPTSVRYDAFFVDCYDGDTCDLDIGLGLGVLIRKRVRFCGIDTPEIKGETKGEAIEARDFVIDTLSNADRLSVNVPVRAKCETAMGTCELHDKYGRLLADVLADGQSVNRALLVEGLAKPLPGDCTFNF